MARGEIPNDSEAGGWIQLTAHRVETSKSSAQSRRRSAAALVASGAAVCLAIVVIVVASNGGRSTNVLFTKEPEGKDPELATINRALALEAAHGSTPAGTKNQGVKLVSAAKAPSPGKASPKESFSTELHKVEKEYSKEIKAAKIKTMEKLQHEEKAALDAVHEIKDEGNADVEKLVKAEKKSEGALRAKQEEAKLSQQLEMVEKDAARRKEQIEAKINAVRSAADALKSKLHSADSGEGQTKKKAEQAPKEQAHKAEASQIEKLEHEVAKLNAKKVAVRAKVHQVEQQQEKERALSDKNVQTASVPAAQPHTDAIKHADAIKPASPPKPTVETAAPKPKPHVSSCTENNCDIRAEDKSLVTNGESIHQLSAVLDGDGSGSRKQRALEEVRALQREIRDDYKHVQSFAYAQEHALDQVKRQTAKELGREVALQVKRSMGSQHPMVLQDSIPEDEKM